jgi:hypothetical protein
MEDAMTDFTALNAALTAAGVAAADQKIWRFVYTQWLEAQGANPNAVARLTPAAFVSRLQQDGVLS